MTSKETQSLKALSLEQADQMIIIQHEEVRKNERRFPIVVAVANGAGLTAVGARLTDTLGTPSSSAAEVLVALLFPSALMFAAGLVIAGVAVVLDLARSQILLVSLQALRMQLIDGDRQEVWVTPFIVAAFLSRWKWELLAGAFFIAGLVWPIVRLGTGYLATGEFSW